MEYLCPIYTRHFKFVPVPHWLGLMVGLGSKNGQDERKNSISLYIYIGGCKGYYSNSLSH